VLAEYIVAKALDIDNKVRIEWDAYDLKTEDGIKIEVKSAAYLQSWKQNKDSNISFSIKPTYGWNSETNEYSTELKRQADVYIFCLLKHKDKVTVNPLRLDQWVFYILSTKVLNEKKTTQEKIELNPLKDLKPVITDYQGIKNAVLELKSYI
jgi:hypothetical protein